MHIYECRLGCRGRGCMVVGFTTKYAIVSLNPAKKIQHDVIKCVSDLRQVGNFLRVLRFPVPIKLTARYN
jgi:hypothetical protein